MWIKTGVRAGMRAGMIAGYGGWARKVKLESDVVAASDAASLQGARDQSP